MKLLDQKIEVWGVCPNDESDTYKWIEKAARECYQSHHKIGPGTDREMCSMLISKDHTSMLEHSQLTVRVFDFSKVPRHFLALAAACKINLYEFGQNQYFIGNYRSWLNMAMCLSSYLKDEKLQCITNEDTFFNLRSRVAKLFQAFKIEFDFIPNNQLQDSHKSITVRLTTSRDVTHELVRHRIMSFAQKSQRYCADRDDLEFIYPYWMEHAENHQNAIDTCYHEWCSCMEMIERCYHSLLVAGKKPQEARVVLPNSTATYIVVTGMVHQWQMVKHLRLSPAAYPPMRKALVDIVDGVFEQLGIKI